MLAVPYFSILLLSQSSFVGFGLYILTFGLAFLETTANPYILAMGDKSTATQRLNLAQAFNPLGLILGLLVAQQFVLKKLQSDNISDFSTLDSAKKIMIRTADLMVIRDPYVILGLVVIGVFVLIAVSKMPQAKDDGEMAPLSSTFKSLFQNVNYRNGVISQVLYVGAQIMCWTYIYQYAEAINISSENAANYQFICFIVFLIGRALAPICLDISIRENFFYNLL